MAYTIGVKFTSRSAIARLNEARVCRSRQGRNTYTDTRGKGSLVYLGLIADVHTDIRLYEAVTFSLPRIDAWIDRSDGGFEW